MWNNRRDHGGGRPVLVGYPYTITGPREYALLRQAGHHRLDIHEGDHHKATELGTGSLAATGIDEVWRFLTPHHQDPPRERVVFHQANNRVRDL